MSSIGSLTVCRRNPWSIVCSPWWLGQSYVRKLHRPVLAIATGNAKLPHPRGQPRRRQRQKQRQQCKRLACLKKVIYNQLSYHVPVECDRSYGLTILWVLPILSLRACDRTPCWRLCLIWNSRRWRRTSSELGWYSVSRDSMSYPSMQTRASFTGSGLHCGRLWRGLPFDNLQPLLDGNYVYSISSRVFIPTLHHCSSPWFTRWINDYYNNTKCSE